jgi:hypothetical protein
MCAETLELFDYVTPRNAAQIITEIGDGTSPRAMRAAALQAG